MNKRADFSLENLGKVVLMVIGLIIGVIIIYFVGKAIVKLIGNIF